MLPLQASGAGDGVIRLWAAESGTGPSAGGAASSGKRGSSSRGLTEIGCLPARGFVNGLTWAPSGRLLVAALAQEPRLGRWGRDGLAQNGVAVYRLAMSDE